MVPASLPLLARQHACARVLLVGIGAREFAT
jgi:hypothetical protein